MTREELIKRVNKFQGANREFSQELPPIIEALCDEIDAAGPEVVNVLTSNSTTKALSANMGKELNALKLDAPETEGATGQVLQIDAEGKPEWVTPSAGTTPDAEMSDVSTNAPQNKVVKSYVDGNFAKPTGRYPEMSVGLAENLVDTKGNGTEQSISFRSSGGSQSIADDGAGLIQELRGKTVKWAQYVTDGATEKTKTVNAGETYAIVTFSTGRKLFNGHKVLVRFDVKTTASSPTCYCQVNNNTLGTNLLIGSAYKSFGFIGTVSDSESEEAQREVRIVITSAAPGDILYGNKCNLFDLTEIFGSGNEPATVDDFYKLFPAKLYGNSTGALINVKDIALETVGFNLIQMKGRTQHAYDSSEVQPTAFKQFNENEYWNGISQSGYYNGNNANTNVELGESSISATMAANDYGIGFPVRCEPNKEYRCGMTCGTGSKFGISFYDRNGVFISVSPAMSAKDTPQTFTTPAGCYWMVIVFGTQEASSYSFTDIKAHYRWSGYKDDYFEPYWKRTLSIPVTSVKSNGAAIFSDGLKSVGSTYDSLYGDKAIKRIGSRAYESGDENNNNVITDGTTTYYVLSTPVEYTLDESWNDTYRVADFGTESVVLGVTDEGLPTTLPLDAVIKYNDDFTREIVNLPKNYISKDSQAELLEALKTAGLITGYTMTWNASLGKYQYVITVS